MPRNMSAAMQTAFAASTIRPALFASIGTETGTVYLWTGFHAVSWSGQTWTPVGGSGIVTPMTETEDIRAVGITLRLSGIPSSEVGTVLGSMRQGLPATVYAGAFDSAGALVADPVLSFSGKVDSVNLEDNGDTTTVEIAVESHLRRLQEHLSRRYTHEDQQIDFPGDRGFEYVNATALGLVKFGGQFQRNGARVNTSPRVL